MKLLVTTVATACLTTACFESGSGSDNGEPDVVRVPGTSARMLGGMTFTHPGPTGPGTAELVNAYYSEDDYLPFGEDGYFDGSMSISIGTRVHASANVDSAWDLIVDDLGEQYIGIAGVQVREDYYGLQTMDHLVIVVPHADVEASATVDLDGVRSFAVYASGDLYNGPDLFATAISGTVTFDSLTGTDPDQLIGASVDADFGAAQLVARPAGGISSLMP